MLRSVVHFLAGQIGLEPASMKLRTTWMEQLVQLWRNVAQVLDALDGGSLEHLLSGIVYVSESICLDLVSEVERIFREQVGMNSSTKGVYLNGYEDEEPCESCRNPAVSWKVVTFLFLLFTGAVVEVEVSSATKSTASCVEMTDLTRNNEPDSSKIPCFVTSTGLGYRARVCTVKPSAQEPTN